MGDLAAEETIRVADMLARDAAALERHLRAGEHDRMSLRGCVLADVQRLHALIARIRVGLEPADGANVPSQPVTTGGVARFEGVAANDLAEVDDECQEPLVMPTNGLFADLEAGVGTFYRGGAMATLPAARQARIVLGWLDALWAELRLIAEELTVEWGGQMSAREARATVERMMAEHATRILSQAVKP